MKHIDTIALQGSIDDMRSRIASEQGAMHKVQLGVARWRGALATPAQAARTADDAPSPPSQVHWHAQAQCHFICWLEQGGFARAQAEFDRQAAPVNQDMAVAVAPAADSGTGAKAAIAQASPAATPLLPAHDCTA